MNTRPQIHKKLPRDRRPCIFVDMESKNVTFHHHVKLQIDANGPRTGHSTVYGK